MARGDYQRYLASREWALLRRAVRERSNGWCERCRFGSHEDTHHLTYERVGHERLDDLLGVCRECHEWLSGRSDYDPVQDWEESWQDYWTWVVEESSRLDEQPCNPYCGCVKCLSIAS